MMRTKISIFCCSAALTSAMTALAQAGVNVSGEGSSVEAREFSIGLDELNFVRNNFGATVSDPSDEATPPVPIDLDHLNWATNNFGATPFPGQILPPFDIPNPILISKPKPPQFPLPPIGTPENVPVPGPGSHILENPEPASAVAWAGLFGLIVLARVYRKPRQ